jgi:trypsin-like peptidase
LTTGLVLGAMTSVTFAANQVEKLAPGVVFLRGTDAAGNSIVGTGFFLHTDGKLLYLVTASHVSRVLSVASSVTIAATNGGPFTFPIKDLVPGATGLAWVVHPHADIAVLRINPARDFIQSHLMGHFMPTSWLEGAKEAPLRTITLTVLGFPLGLGVSQEHFSPVSRETKAASGLVELRWGDNRTTSIFFITQDPSVGGFSGAPVFDTRLPHATENTGLAIEVGRDPRIVGLVHGTLPDDTGGKLGAIVPSFLILEVLATLAARP